MVQNFVTVNMTQWHTWGVIWTPSSIILVVDGREWGEYTTASEIPQRTMTLDLEQRTSCSKGLECPTVAESMEIDWVAEYVKQ
jgi:beta-glucanase (GH16 family)